MLLVELDKLGLWQPRVDFNLVARDGDVVLVGQKRFDVGDGEVGDTDCAGFAGGDEILHCFPSWDETSFVAWKIT